MVLFNFESDAAELMVRLRELQVGSLLVYGFCDTDNAERKGSGLQGGGDCAEEN